jgi:hypothetical protein
MCPKEAQINRGQKSKFCGRICRNAYRREKTGLTSAYPGLPTGTVGAINELRACVDLMEKGYEVFRAVSSACSCDLAVLKDGQLLRIEVLTAYRITATGKLLGSHNSKKDFGRQDHFAFMLPNEIVYEPPLPKLIPESDI